MLYKFFKQPFAKRQALQLGYPNTFEIRILQQLQAIIEYIGFFVGVCKLQYLEELTFVQIIEYLSPQNFHKSIDLEKFHNFKILNQFIKQDIGFTAVETPHDSIEVSQLKILIDLKDMLAGIFERSFKESRLKPKMCLLNFDNQLFVKDDPEIGVRVIWKEFSQFWICARKRKWNQNLTHNFNTIILKMVNELLLRIIIRQQNIMTERKNWSPQEDECLRILVEDRKITKWAEIAEILQNEFNLIDRSGKQCRERWHNRLDPTIRTEGWSIEEQQLLFKIHNQYGNKWAKISQRLPGRTDNCIKNHFYSTLRKAVRRLNKFITDHRIRGEFKEISNAILYKVIAVAEDRFDNKHEAPQQLIETCVKIKENLFKFSNCLQLNTQQEEEVKLLIGEIANFNKTFRKRKNKTSKRSSQCRSCEDNQSFQNNKTHQEINESPERAQIQLKESYSLICQSFTKFDRRNVAEIEQPNLNIPLIDHQFKPKKTRNLIVCGFKRLPSIEISSSRQTIERQEQRAGQSSTQNTPGSQKQSPDIRPLERKHSLDTSKMLNWQCRKNSFWSTFTELLTLSTNE